MRLTPRSSGPEDEAARTPSRSSPDRDLSRPRVGLALSGGGFRATAFGLGALRALHDRDVLNDVNVVSGISGGSLLAAMWAYGPADFDDFDTTVVDLLRSGLQRELLRRAIAPGLAGTNLLSNLNALPGTHRTRNSTRTEALVDALTARGFGAKTLTEVTHPGTDVVISATDLSTGNAVRFGSRTTSCSPHGRTTDTVPVADAVAASAAFPVLLPHLSRSYTFTRNDGTTHRETMLMTDGGVYDNLGLSPLMPGRSKVHTSHAYDLDYLIAVDAGIGRVAPRPPNRWPGRMARSFGIAHTREQDGLRARIHDAHEHGQIVGFVYSYLGLRDRLLPFIVPDLVPREAVFAYPTNFAALAPVDLDALSTRGEQLTRVLIDAYCPRLGSN